MLLHVTLRDGMGSKVGDVLLEPGRRHGTTQEYLMTVNVDRGASVGMYRQTVVIEQNANPVGMLLSALLFLDPEHRVLEGEVVDSSSDSDPGPPALER